MCFRDGSPQMFEFPEPPILWIQPRWSLCKILLAASPRWFWSQVLQGAVAFISCSHELGSNILEMRAGSSPLFLRPFCYNILYFNFRRATLSIIYVQCVHFLGFTFSQAKMELIAASAMGHQDEGYLPCQRLTYTAPTYQFPKGSERVPTLRFLGFHGP